MLLFWNVRGLNDPSKQYQLKRYLKSFNGNIICLLETHVQQDKMDSVVKLLRPGWVAIENYPFSPLGRVWILHNDEVVISVLRSSSQAIHCHVFSIPLQRYFFLSVIYASNNASERRSLWQ